jgi:hypothetical protein
VFLVFSCAELHRQAECLELEELAAISVNPTLLPILNHLLLEVYAVLRPKPLDYDQRNTLVDVIRKITKQIFGMFLFLAVVTIVYLNVTMNLAFKFNPTR